MSCTDRYGLKVDDLSKTNNSDEYTEVGLGLAHVSTTTIFKYKTCNPRCW